MQKGGDLFVQIDQIIAINKGTTHESPPGPENIQNGHIKYIHHQTFNELREPKVKVL